MEIRLISGRDVARLLPVDDCTELMRETMFRLGKGEAQQPLRMVMGVQGSSGLISMMPAQVGSILGFKSVTVYPDNRGTSLPTHQAVIGLIDSQTGAMVALVDGTSITELRTAAVSAVATREMARDGASTMLVIGAGAQARAHVVAIEAALDLEEIRVWNRDASRARALVDDLGPELSTPLRAVDAAEEGARGADIIVTATSAAEPVVARGWIEPGTHINAVGACIPTARELDTRTIVDARLIVDRIESALSEAGELVIPLQANDIDRGKIAGELGSVLTGEIPGRTDSAEITVFKSLGLGIQDIAAANLVYEAAVAEGAGTVVDV